MDTNNAHPHAPETQRQNGNETVAAEFAEVTNDVECLKVKEPRMMNQIRGVWAPWRESSRNVKNKKNDGPIRFKLSSPEFETALQKVLLR